MGIEDGTGEIVGYIACQCQRGSCGNTSPVVDILFPTGGEFAGSLSQVADDEAIGVAGGVALGTQNGGIAQQGALDVGDDGQSAETLEEPEIAGGTQETGLAFGFALDFFCERGAFAHAYDDIGTLTHLLPG